MEIRKHVEMILLVMVLIVALVLIQELLAFFGAMTR